MNIQEYISSGIVETYVLDLCDEKESASFERMCSNHAEVKSARDAFEKLIEEQAVAHAIQPPRHLKSRIFAHIEIESEKKEGIVARERDFDKDHPKINWVKYLATAAMILLFVSTALNFYLFNTYRSFVSKAETQQLLTGNQEVVQKRLKNYAAVLALIKDPDMKPIDLKPAQPVHAGVPARVFRSDRKADLFLVVNGLPPSAGGKRYHLWGIVAGKPVNAGSFTISSEEDLIRLKNIPQADSFAVSVEKDGAINTPSVQKLFITGSIKR